MIDRADEAARAARDLRLCNESGIADCEKRLAAALRALVEPAPADTGPYAKFDHTAPPPTPAPPPEPVYRTAEELAQAILGDAWLVGGHESCMRRVARHLARYRPPPTEEQRKLAEQAREWLAVWREQINTGGAVGWIERLANELGGKA